MEKLEKKIKKVNYHGWEYYDPILIDYEIKLTKNKGYGMFAK